MPSVLYIRFQGAVTDKMEANVKTVTPKRKAEANDEKIVTKSNTKQQNSTVTSVKHIVKPNIHSVGQFACDIPGKRCFDVRGVSFVVHEKYNIVKVIGVGAYGIVTAAMDMQTGQKVALKKISGVFEDATDTKRVLREIRLMKALNHENVSINKSVGFVCLCGFV